METPNKIRRSFKMLGLATIGLFLVVLALAGYTWYLNNQTTHALCTLRGDLQSRVANSQKFLKKHPDGAFGFTRAEIQASIKNQQQTVDALSNLSC